jgi:hypothetical protein
MGDQIKGLPSFAQGFYALTFSCEFFISSPALVD